VRQLLTERYRGRLAGVLSCYDRIIVTGTLPGACYAKGMTGFLSARQIRIFDYPRFAEPLRDRVRDRATELASTTGVIIEHIAKNHLRKEDIVAKVLAARGDHPGLVHIISAMEACDSYKPWHDKQTHRTFLRPDTGKCLHYYFYFLDAELGLIYLRVPTWCPFRLQFYCNGHRWLARQLAPAGIGFTLADNAFLHIDDWQRAQTLADRLSPDDLHRILDRYAQQCCPVLDVFAQSYHWSFMQVEYATDLVFRSQAILKPLYEQLSRQAILTVKAEHVATFLGHKITPQLVQEIGSQFATRIEETCVKHRFGKSSIKIYDKFGLVLRIETTTNDVSAFKHYRKVEHRQGPATRSLAPVRKDHLAGFAPRPCAAICALLGLAVPSCAGAVVHFTGCIDPNLTDVPGARSGALARSWCRLGRRGYRAGRGRAPRLHAAMAAARAGALHSSEGNAVLARSGDNVRTLCADRAMNDMIVRPQLGLN
jgi:hypothetical protein